MVGQAYHTHCRLAVVSKTKTTHCLVLKWVDQTCPHPRNKGTRPLVLTQRGGCIFTSPPAGLCVLKVAVSSVILCCKLVGGKFSLAFFTQYCYWASGKSINFAGCSYSWSQLIKLNKCLKFERKE